MVNSSSDAPEFDLYNQNGETVSLTDFDGSPVVVYFYPMANSDECAIEAKQFRETWKQFKDHEIEIVGISTDSEEAIADFHENYDLPFDLLSDIDGEVAKQYGTFATMETDDGVFEYATRETFLIGMDGTIERHYQDVSLDDGHAEEVLDDATA